MKRAITIRRTNPPGTAGLSRVLPQIRALIEASRQHVVSTANLTLVWLYWNVGRVITEDIQQHPGRADYGQRLIEQLSTRLAGDYGRGFSAPNLWDMKRFFEGFEILQAVPSESATAPILQTASRESAETEKLPAVTTGSADTPIRQTPSSKFPTAEILSTVSRESSAGSIQQAPPAKSSDRIRIDFTTHHHIGWSHYRSLLSLEAGLKRQFYFEQSTQQRWSVRELSRQIDRALFERVALSGDTRALIRLEKQRGPVETVRYEDAFKDPYLLDFLGLKGAYSEKDLESAILSNLQQFLTELGTGFCFIGRQYPMRIDDDDYFLDLLFFHRGLRCLVAVDLKIGPFTAADKGQMDLYLAWLKRHEWRQRENEPVGLILCTSKKRQHVELLLGSGPHKMQVSEYLTQLPPKRVLQERLKLYSRLLDQDTPEK